jgi:hypothetical protein
VGTSTSHNAMGLHGLLQGALYLFNVSIISCRDVLRDDIFYYYFTII